MDYLLLPLLREEGHELLVAVHVDDGGGGGDDDAGEEVEQHRDWGIQQERLVFVQNILWADHVYLEKVVSDKTLTMMMVTLYMMDMAEKAIRFWSPLPTSWIEKRKAIALLVFQKTAGYL